MELQSCVAQVRDVLLLQMHFHNSAGPNPGRTSMAFQFCSNLKNLIFRKKHVETGNGRPKSRLRARCCYPRRAVAAPTPSPCFPLPQSSACLQTACVSCCSGSCASRYPIRPGVVVVAGLWMLWVITGPRAPQQAFWARVARLLNEQSPESAVKAARG